MTDDDLSRWAELGGGAGEVHSDTEGRATYERVVALVAAESTATATPSPMIGSRVVDAGEPDRQRLGTWSRGCR